MLVLVGFDELSNFGTGSNRFDEYDVSLVQQQKAGLRACPAKEKGPGSIGKHLQKPSSGVELLCLSWVGISSCGPNSVMILTPSKEKKEVVLFHARRCLNAFGGIQQIYPPSFNKSFRIFLPA
jgi:hypothetical protein